MRKPKTLWLHKSIWKKWHKCAGKRENNTSNVVPRDKRDYILFVEHKDKKEPE